MTWLGPSVLLADRASSKDNNFNLIRLLAAFAVLVSHSLILATGHFRDNPIPARLESSLGSIAVDVFFIVSGFLVTGSLATRQNLKSYLIARALRIYPAMAVMLTVTIGLIGSHFSTLPWRAYFTHAETWHYALMNLTLVFGHADTLPGVFETTPTRGLVNGSLWTIPYELRCYLLLGCIWLLTLVVRGSRMRAFRTMAITIGLALWVVHPIDHFFLKTGWPFVQFVFMFMSGSICHLLKDRIRLSTPVFLTLMAALLLSTVNGAAFFLIYRLTLPYLVMWLAYIPAGGIRIFNKIGDYSYGFYIFAFPLQQSIMSLLPQASIVELIALSGLAALACSILSWHVIEKNALHLKP